MAFSGSFSHALMPLFAPAGAAFAPCMARVHPKILHGLTSITDSQLCSAAIMAVGDLARALADQFKPFVPCA